MKKHLFKLFYAAAVILLLIFVIGLAAAVILLLIFVIGLAAAWFWYQDVSKNPLVELVLFSSIVKDYALKFLLPAAVCTAVGYILQRFRKK